MGTKDAHWVEPGSNKQTPVEANPVGVDRKSVEGIDTNEDHPDTWMPTQPARDLCGLRVTAADILQFDPQKRRLKTTPKVPSVSRPSPGNFFEEEEPFFNEEETVPQPGYSKSPWMAPKTPEDLQGAIQQTIAELDGIYESTMNSNRTLARISMAMILALQGR